MIKYYVHFYTNLQLKKIYVMNKSLKSQTKPLRKYSNQKQT